MQPLAPLDLPLSGVRLIEASAGTGKTYTIANLYLRLILERRLSVRQILVVTYTKAATEELRDRLRTRLRDALTALQGGETADDLLRAQLSALADPAEAITRLQDEITCIDEAAVFTIHGFCQRMLQENAFESGTLFDAELLENENELLLGVVEDYWRRTFQGSDAALAELALEVGIACPSDLHLRVRDWVAKPELEIHPLIAPDDVDEGAFLRLHARLHDLWNRERAALIETIDNCKDLSRGPYKADELAAAAEHLDGWFADTPAPYALPDGFELFTAVHLDKSITKAKRAKGARAPAHEFFDLCDQAAGLRRLRGHALLRDAILQIREERARRKADRGLLAFDDLLTQLRGALEGPGGATLAAHIAGRYPVALIDEFQDTDPQQYRIFAAIYGTAPVTGLFMIGDPKQAIYSFRGADVFTYMGAKADTVPEARYTLDTNWRSTDALVQGVNALFAGCTAPFIFQGHIDFHPVRASGKADKEPLVVEGDGPQPLRLWFVPMTEENKARNPPPGIVKEWLNSHLPEACAEEIVRLLNLGARGAARVGDTPLQPRHMAVLVRSRFQAELVQAALRARRVNSAYYGRESVYESEEADELERVLLAIAEPTRESVLRAALCSRLWGMSAAALSELQQDDEAWETRVVRAQEYQRQWLAHGFMHMFRSWLHDEQVAARLLAEEGGERRVTNLLQLGELLQQAGREHHGIERLLRWFAEQRSDADGDIEEQQLRLESDEDLVKIVTVHKSKGLEYPVVFLPFAWDARPLDAGEPVLYHDAERRSVLDLAAGDASYAAGERERLAEELRLLYVALTRAKYRCYLPWGRFRGAERGALAWLLHGNGQCGTVKEFGEAVLALEEHALRQRLESWAAEATGGVAVEPLPAPTDVPYTPRAAGEPVHRAREVIRGARSDWRVTSYTALASGHGHGERPDYGSQAEDAAAPVPATRGLTLLQFPRGSRPGTFMHRLLERIDFPTAAGATLRPIIEKELQRSGYGMEWLPAMEEMVANTLDTPLAPGLRLRDVTAPRRLIELEFHYPLRHLHAADLDRVAAGLGTYHTARPALQFGQANGIMRGFIDLVFEHQGRFYIADYKSNFLGPRREEYQPDALRTVVAANRYDLQYLIYSVALHRYLQRRLRDYDYDRHVGGVYYLFLRGMSPAQPGLGVHADRPPRALVEALDALFDGRRP
jgi:exodeoxyribonuclease V beta subunit